MNIKYMKINMFLTLWLSGVASTTFAHNSTESIEDDDLRVFDISADDKSGIKYRRVESSRDILMQSFKNGVLGVMDVPFTPAQAKGSPGVAIFDFDLDGDKDIYVTNGPSRANSMYSSQLNETGHLEYIDVGAISGAGAQQQDSQGVCFGDIDNDGDKDLYVLGSNEDNILFENNGDGSFTDITQNSRTGGGSKTSVTCSFGDINNDGLLDIVVANTFNFENRFPLMVVEFEDNMEHNDLFVNKGDNIFEDMSEVSGINSFRGVSWSIAMVDYDADGDLDIFVAEDQGTRLPKVAGGENFGSLRVFDNDGKGYFTDKTISSGLDKFGAWMSLSFGDLNGDGHIDLFASNIGDYFAEFVGPLIPGLPFKDNLWSSRWFYSDGKGSFYEPGISDLKSTPFGWASSIIDYDNDGDNDIVFHGGVDMSMFVDATNPGVILNNDGKGEFVRDKSFLKKSRNHVRRDVQGMAVGDLNNDGYYDFVTVASSEWPEPLVLKPIIDRNLLFGGEFDDTAYIWDNRTQVDPDDKLAGFTWNDIEPVQGTLVVEISNGSNKNNSATLQLVGGMGNIPDGKVNRDGIGSIVKLTPKGGNAITKPVVSGGSFASADSLEVIFGIGKKVTGDVEIQWPGGIKNKLYGVRSSEKLVFPEIPCSYDDKNMSKTEYETCVNSALHSWVDNGVIEIKEIKRFKLSAIIARAKYKYNMSKK